MVFVEIKIIEFENYIKRTDVKTPTWFGLEHNIMLHPDFFEVTGDEVRVFLWVVGVAAHCKLQKLKVFIDLCARQLNVDRNVVVSTIEKLTGKRWSVTGPSQTCTDSVHVCTGNNGATPATEERREEERREEKRRGEHNTHTFEPIVPQSDVIPAKPEPGQLHQLICLWNELRKDLPIVKKSNAERDKSIKRLFTKLTVDEWRAAITHIADSDFCNGRLPGKTWVADFDWLLGKDKNGKMNYTKAHEERFPNRESVSPKTFNQIREDNLKKLEKKWE